MSISLPQETQTQKLKSLDGDLRDIAEELIADKFDIKEEVVEVSSASFRQRQGYEWTRTVEAFSPELAYISDEPDVFDINRGTVNYRQYRIDEPSTRVDYQTRQRVTTLPLPVATTRCIRNAIEIFNKFGLPRNGRVVRMEPIFWMELKRSEDFTTFLNFVDGGRGYKDGDYVGSMFGCKLYVSPYNTTELEVRHY